ncbi:MAG: iron ABC transporter permease [Deltaproteobacteria bacterium]|nr:iron ABC transporter permease [Deltaproteobacteria bacterium]
MSRITYRIWLRRMFFLSALLLGAVALALSLGAVSIPLSETWSIFISGLSGGPAEYSPEASLLFGLRWPRVTLAALEGAALSLSGAVLQALLRNPLADPYILGVSGGAALGAVLALLFGLGTTVLGGQAVAGAAFGGALITLCGVYLLARVGGRVSSQTMLLAGVIVNSFHSAVILLLISVTGDERLYTVTFWLMGSLESVRPRHLPILSAYLLCGAAVLLSRAKELNLMSMGEETAAQLGVDVEQVKITVFVLTSLITGAIVSVSGLIGFAGLIVPHLVRLIWGSDHRLLLPASALLGAAFLVLADLVARTVLAPLELPVGVVTGLAGAPFFAYLLRRKELAAHS